MRLKTQKQGFKMPDESGNFDFSYTINVDSEGSFTTTLPQETVERLSSLGVEMAKNRAGREGFVWANSLPELTEKVSNLVKEATSRDLIDERIVIRYNINTRCSYGINEAGEIIPNLSYDWAGREELKWKGGTQQLHANQRDAFGIDIFVGIQIKRSYKYRSGKIKEEFEHCCYAPDKIKEFYKDDYAYQFLSGLAGMGERRALETRVVDYDPDFANMLVSMIKSICVINEKIKPLLLDHQTLLEHAKSGNKLIG